MIHESSPLARAISLSATVGASLASLAASATAPQAPAQIRLRVVQVDDGGPSAAVPGVLPVVFVHSFAGSTQHWKEQLEHLRPTRRAMAIDLRGHGASKAPADGDYSVAALASDIELAVDEHHVDRFVLVGHSLGGSAAIAYAAEHPGRVAGLVLVGTPGRSPEEQSAQVLAALETDYEKTMQGYWTKLLAGAKPEVERRIQGERSRTGRQASVSLIRAVFDFDPIPGLARYPGPKLLIDTPQGDSPTSLAALRPDIPRRVLEGTSHWPQLDLPAEFDRLLDDFLATVR
jgi:pimeloyl-ACP methyl ester carboxylesterase